MLTFSGSKGKSFSKQAPLCLRALITPATDTPRFFTFISSLPSSWRSNLRPTKYMKLRLMRSTSLPVSRGAFMAWYSYAAATAFVQQLFNSRWSSTGGQCLRRSTRAGSLPAFAAPGWNSSASSRGSWARGHPNAATPPPVRPAPGPPRNDPAVPAPAAPVPWSCATHACCTFARGRVPDSALGPCPENCPKGAPPSPSPSPSSSPRSSPSSSSCSSSSSASELTTMAATAPEAICLKPSWKRAREPGGALSVPGKMPWLRWA
mmetsp:Transcript_3763/g.7288  ORF Transcript_3763/g.7288 Transcript_3763/m.7288 type:complete len:263 (-) Transcript_3763:70-858(-)